MAGAGKGRNWRASNSWTLSLRLQGAHEDVKEKRDQARDTE